MKTPVSGRELVSWLLVAYLIGSLTTPRAGAQYPTQLNPVLWAIRNAIARNCEVAGVEHNAIRFPEDQYDTRRCWQ